LKASSGIALSRFSLELAGLATKRSPCSPALANDIHLRELPLLSGDLALVRLWLRISLIFSLPGFGLEPDRF